MSDLDLWFHTPSPLQSSWGCVCRALSHWCTQHTPKRGIKNAKIAQKNFTSKTNPFKVTLIDFFFSRSKKTLRPEGFHLQLFKAAPIDTLLFCIALCKWRCASPGECVSASICVTSPLWCLRCCVGWARGALPWIRHGRRRSGRCTSAGFFALAKGHRRTDRWAGRWFSARPVEKHTHRHTHWKLFK